MAVKPVFCRVLKRLWMVAYGLAVGSDGADLIRLQIQLRQKLGNDLRVSQNKLIGAPCCPVQFVVAGAVQGQEALHQRR